MKTLFVALTFAISGFAQSAINADWKKVKTRKNVEVFKAKIENSPVVAFKGTGYIDAPITKVVSVIRDDSKKAEWISDLAETRVLQDNGLTHKVEYNRTATPWPLTDRDFVYEVKVAINKEKKEVVIDLINATHPAAPEKKDAVRGALHSSRYFLKSVDNDKRTYVEVQILADPKGKVPKWVVNIFQSVWPSNTIDGIRAIAEDPNYETLPDVRAFVARLYN